MELDTDALDALSDTELAELAHRLQNEAQAKHAHAYALLGCLNDRRRGVTATNGDTKAEQQGVL